MIHSAPLFAGPYLEARQMESTATTFTPGQRKTIARAIRERADSIGEALDLIERLRRNRQGIPFALLDRLQQESSGATLLELAARVEAGELHPDLSDAEPVVMIRSYIDLVDEAGSVAGRIVVEDEEYAEEWGILPEDYNAVSEIHDEGRPNEGGWLMGGGVRGEIKACGADVLTTGGRFPSPTPHEIVFHALKANGR